MSIQRSLLLIVRCIATFGAIGALLGLAMGINFPWYYRGMYPEGHPTDFTPIRAGIMLGAIQGGVLGTLVGCVLILAQALASRSSKAALAWDADLPAPPPRRRGCLGIVLTAVVSASAAGLVGFVLGLLKESRIQTERQCDTIRQILVDPRYRGVTAEICPENNIHVDGRVTSEEDRRALQELLRSRFGDRGAPGLAIGVQVDRP